MQLRVLEKDQKNLFAKKILQMQFYPIFGCLQGKLTWKSLTDTS